MLDFCAEHGIPSDVEMITMQAINGAYERILKSGVKCRFVIGTASLKWPDEARRLPAPAQEGAVEAGHEGFALCL